MLFDGPRFKQRGVSKQAEDQTRKSWARSRECGKKGITQVLFVWHLNHSVEPFELARFVMSGVNVRNGATPQENPPPTTCQTAKFLQFHAFPCQQCRLCWGSISEAGYGIPQSQHSNRLHA